MKASGTFRFLEFPAGLVLNLLLFVFTNSSPRARSSWKGNNEDGRERSAERIGVSQVFFFIWLGLIGMLTVFSSTRMLWSSGRDSGFHG